MTNFYTIRKSLPVVVMLMVFSLSAFAQAMVKGTVVSGDDGEPIPGVNVLIKGSASGTITDFNGAYQLQAKKSDVLVFSFVGYKPKEVLVGDQQQIDVKLGADVKSLNEVVVIGYGSAKKSDLTGSVTAITASDFNQGAISSPQELLNGKVPGVQITNGGGAPGAGATIRIRGGASLNASNDPLIIIDGVPMDNGGVAGMRNPLNTINPSDIETFTVLKDASATAIYGSRASNGVIIITTKKGTKGKMTVDYTGTVSVGQITGKLDMLNANQYRELTNAKTPENAHLLGDANTDWQDAIFRTAISTDHNIAVSGSLKDIPYRVSLGYNNSQGVLKKSDMQRTTLALNLNPKFFNDNLKTNMSVKVMGVKNNFSNEGAIGAAGAFDPTQPIYSDNKEFDQFGGYFTWLNDKGVPQYSIAPGNPMALINQRHDEADVFRSVGNLSLDYSMPFLKGLSANLNVGYDYSKSNGDTNVDANAGFDQGAVTNQGTFRSYEQTKNNNLLDFYMKYASDLPSIDGKFDVMGGYSYQYFKKEDINHNSYGSGQEHPMALEHYKNHNNLQSFFARANFSLSEKYMFTATVRADGSSRFSEDNRWGIFPAAAFAWNMDKESFLASSNTISTMKLRLGYGITGQQDIGSEFGYMPVYATSVATSRYTYYDRKTGEAKTFNTIRPSGYDQDLKWEQTTTYNAGVDFGFLDDRFSGALEVYYRNTADLLNYIPVPAGSNLTNMLTTNVGAMENKGVEFNLNSKLVQSKDFNFDLGVNFTYNDNKITSLTMNDDPDYDGVRTGGVEGGQGVYAQRHRVGYPASAFFMYEQVYDKDGHPVEGMYKDQDGDGKITENDLKYLGNPAPKFLLGLTTRMTYKNWDFSAAARASLGNKVYNNVASNKGNYNTLHTSGQVLNNVHASVFDTKFQHPQLLSNYYLENGSFLRIDNVMIGYNFFNVFGSKMNARVYGTVNNVAVITGYDGLDPEVFGGIDNNAYPRPRTYMLGVNLSF